MNKILTFIALSVLLFKGNSPFTNPTYSKQQDKAINVSNLSNISYYVLNKHIVS